MAAIWVSVIFALSIFVIFVIKYYQNIRLIIADIISAFSFVGKRLKKFSLVSEVEGAINSISEQVNKEMPEPILPRCKVKWVDPDKQETILKENEAIICLSFDKKDRGKNLYNALYSFVRTGLIDHAKPFLNKDTSKAIDLLSTKVILLRSRPRVLQIFNENFAQEHETCKKKFYLLETIDENGVFQSILIPELKLFGDKVFTKTPNSNIEREAERFVSWLYTLVTRERREESILSFEGNNFKVGVILVADSEIYDQYGIEAYVRRAYLYASKDYPCVYLMATGDTKSSVSYKIAEVLTSNEHFTKLNKKTHIIRYNEEGNRFLITCINLRINHDIIRYDFWSFVKEAKENNTTLKAEIYTVRDDSVIVSYLGKRFTLYRGELSQIEIYDLHKYFHPHEILSLKVIDYNQDEDLVHFSNKNTETDPAGAIEANLSSELKFSITRIINSKNDYEVGLLAYNSEKELYGFVPKSLATCSRFTKLSEQYHVGQKLDLEIQKYDPERNNYVCKVSNLTDPWGAIPSELIAINKIVEAEIKEINYSYITCSIAEGVEGRIYIKDLSWDSIETNKTKLKDFKIGASIKAKIVNVDVDKRIINLSIKVLKGSPTIEFFEKNRFSIVKCVITGAFENGINVLINSNITGFIHKSEVSWFYLQNVTHRYKINDRISVKIISYDDKHQNLICSIKAAQQNDFETLALQIKEGDIVEGEVIRFYEDKAEIKIKQNGLFSYGFVHKSEVSNILFISEEICPKILVPGLSYKFVVRRINTNFMTFTLSRKAYYKKVINHIEYGREYEVNVVNTPSKMYFYSDDLEGELITDSINLSGKVKVTPASIKDSWVEMYIN